MKGLLATALLLISTASWAVEIPDEKTKIEALKLAYELNGKSMVRWGTIDLSGPPPEKAVRTIPIVPDQKKKRDRER